MQDKNGKTEKPTAHRLRKARREGNVPRSQDLSSALSLLVFAVVLIPLWEYVIEHFIPYLIELIEQLANYQRMITDLPKIALQVVLMILFLSAPFFVLSLSIGFLSNFLQVGVLFTTKTLKPDFKKLNPLKGFKQMFSMRALENLIKTLAKFGIVVYFCYRKFMEYLPGFYNLSDIELPQILIFVLKFAQALSLQTAIVLLILAFFDYGYQFYSHRRDLRMTKQEVKDEFKQQEGDPRLKAQRRSKYAAMVRNSLKQVKDATVLVTNPTHLALAIKYDADNEGVPRLLAKGADRLAQQMRAEARKYDVPIIENRPLAWALYGKVEPGDFVPEELYESVAEVIALVYKLNEQAKNKI
ncbi:MAG: EscU/YscU/HrcU family type III secretion system export apparatus switch protein [Liquorilactobacillus nagelii]|jgi:flagellar biosynthetic protein FlhB|uniref:EscU/YscU/HrcU family type III secretion system export apparatus switch protein n=1 Tax=Liquorilactobacillus nagelii TaxID=82688 RepID=UPI0024302A8C|nr:EscU/YscU/HrcU family type III secretion system export apparatus switch protein [Liquorilactobacillus nagelii]MCI1920791.1 EscU/YscU/HrcU family type III secretion system export apparatus switch protein [Liquorilactobacillus nagelii]MCI1976877.1 EscU/YscU/HrcU family type III secretion system export apparatus switch protein [Liquorilactobacillus nagelii]